MTTLGTPLDDAQHLRRQKDAQASFLFPAVLSASVSQRYLTDATMESINSTPPSMSSLSSNQDTSMCPSSNTSISTRKREWNRVDR